MTPLARKIAYSLLTLLVVIPCRAQRGDDPLNDIETDQIRDAAQSPDERLKLYVDFAKARLDAVEQSRTDPNVKDHAKAIHDHLQDFLTLYDELNKNVDNFADRNEDLRKALKIVIDGDTDFQVKLRHLEDAPAATTLDKTQYEFLLSTALHAVDDGAQDHRQLLAEQEEAAKHKKSQKTQTTQTSLIKIRLLWLCNWHNLNLLSDSPFLLTSPYPCFERLLQCLCKIERFRGIPY